MVVLGKAGELITTYTKISLNPQLKNLLKNCLEINIMNIKRIVTDIINKWDPIELMAHAPKNEYEHEIDEICKALSKENINAEKFAKVIQNVLLRNSGIFLIRAIANV